MMHVLATRPALSDPQGPPLTGASGPYGEVLSAYRLAMAGLYTRAGRRFAVALEQLERRREQQPLLYAHGLALAGLASRGSCDFETAARWLRQACEASLAARAGAMAQLSLALSLEAAAASGQIEQAAASLEEFAARKTPVSTDLAQAMLQVAKGKVTEGGQLAQMVRTSAASRDLEVWATLVWAEARMDAGRPLEVEKDLEGLVARFESERDFQEAYVRALVGLARQRVEAIWTEGKNPGRAELERAETLVRKALRYSKNFARYQAAALASRAQLRMLQDPRRGEKPLARALGLLEQCEARLDHGRVLAQHVVFGQHHLQRPARLLIARARDLLARAGAHPRSQALIQSEGDGGAQGLGASAMVSKSMLGRSVMSLGASEEVELEAIFKVNEAIASILDLDELLQRILDEVIKVLKAERGALLRRMPDGSIRCVAARKLVPERVRPGGDEISFSIIDEVERTGQVILTDNAQLDQRFRGKASVMAAEIRSLMCAPLRTQKALLGFLYIDSTVTARIFKPEHRELLAVFATQAAVSLENALAFSRIEEFNRDLEKKVEERTAELAESNRALEASLDEIRNVQLKLVEAQRESLEKEMLVARDIQRSIVPASAPIERPGLQLIGELEPASHVGGDFWTFLALPGDRTLVLIGDVTGHGVGAGMLTAVAKASADTLMRKLGDVSPEALLQTLSDVLHDSSKGKLMMTAFACLVDPTQRVLTFANAGHAAPLYLEYAGGLPKLGALVSRGPRLGSALGQTYTLKSRAYQPGDRVLLFTDGLVECTNAAGEAFSDKRLRRALIETATAPLLEQQQSLRNQAHAFFADHPREDDVTFILAALGEVPAFDALPPIG